MTRLKPVFILICGLFWLGYSGACWDMALLADTSAMLVYSVAVATLTGLWGLALIESVRHPRPYRPYRGSSK